MVLRAMPASFITVRYLGVKRPLSRWTGPSANPEWDALLRREPAVRHNQDGTEKIF